MFGYDLGIDLGTSSLVIAVPGKGVVLNEPSYVAYDKNSDKILYAGRRAYFLQGREPDNVSVIQPLRDGVISNYTYTEQLLKHYVRKVLKNTVFKPRVIACIPATTTDVEKRTLVSVLITSGAKSVCLIEEPLCAAFGADINPLQPDGVFVIDIGGGTTDMAVISQGTMNQTETVRIAGDNFDEEIAKYLKNQYGLLVGMRTAEDIKIQIGSAILRSDEIVMTARGRDVVQGLPLSVDISSNEICQCLTPMFKELTSAAQLVFERTSPQLVSDISNSKVILTGGCAQIYGMDQLFSNALGLDVEVAAAPNLCVAKGAVKALDKMHILDHYGYQFLTKEDAKIR